MPAGRPPKNASKAKKTAAKPAHPPYQEMITEAIQELNEKKGSSRKAILNYIDANFKIDDRGKAQVRVKLAIRKLVETKEIFPVLKKGKIPVNGTYKLASSMTASQKSMVKKAPKANNRSTEKPVKKVTNTNKSVQPKWQALIIEAMKALDAKKGSSRKAILNHIVANHTIEDRAKAQVRVKVHMKKLVEANEIFPVLKNGKVAVNGSYKLATTPSGAVVARGKASYKVMICDAIKALKNENGSSRKAILNHIVANYSIEDEDEAQDKVKQGVRKLVAAKKIVPVLVNGKVAINGTFKINMEPKEPKPKKVKKAKVAEEKPDEDKEAISEESEEASQ